MHNKGNIFSLGQIYFEINVYLFLSIAVLFLHQAKMTENCITSYICFYTTLLCYQLKKGWFLLKGNFAIN